jgi:hypothetical protein
MIGRGARSKAPRAATVCGRLLDHHHPHAEGHEHDPDQDQDAGHALTRFRIVRSGYRRQCMPRTRRRLRRNEGPVLLIFRGERWRVVGHAVNYHGCQEGGKGYATACMFSRRDCAMLMALLRRGGVSTFRCFRDEYPRRHRFRRNRLSRPPRRSTSPRARVFRSDRLTASGPRSQTLRFRTVSSIGRGRHSRRAVIARLIKQDRQ